MPAPNKLTEVVYDIGHKILRDKKRNYMPACTAEQTAAYLLANALDPIRRVNSICYALLTEPLSLEHIPFAKQNSERGQGIFKPLSNSHKKAFMKAIQVLKEAGIVITSCEDTPYQNTFFTQNGDILKIIVNSFSVTIPKIEEAGGYTYLTPNLLSQPMVYILGVKENMQRPILVILHEIGHILGLPHFPPNFGPFKEDCAAEYQAPEQIQKLKKLLPTLPCAVDNPAGSIMFCNSAAIDVYEGTLQPGDEIAFKKQYKRILGQEEHTTPVKKRASSSKIELTVNSGNSSSLFSFLQNISQSTFRFFQNEGAKRLDNAFNSVTEACLSLGKNLSSCEHYFPKVDIPSPSYHSTNHLTFFNNSIRECQSIDSQVPLSFSAPNGVSTMVSSLPGPQ